MHSFYRVGYLGLTLLAACMPVTSFANDASPVGLWKNIDDVTGKPRALIRIAEVGGTFEGRIENVFPAPNEEQSPVCVKCEGSNKNAPVVGLVILTGLVKDGDEYTDGQILDPDSGNIYSSKVSVIEGGKKLSVRGYLGMPILGRTQTWVRQE